MAKHVFYTWSFPSTLGVRISVSRAVGKITWDHVTFR